MSYLFSASVSALLFSVLSLVGLVFFIRASVKERLVNLQVLLGEEQTEILERVKDYLLQRGYGISEVRPAEQTLFFSGQVRPSWFLGIFLSVLAALGGGCLVLALLALTPTLADKPFLLALPLLLSPLAGLFYWRRSARATKICLKVGPTTAGAGGAEVLTIVARRDEVKQLRQNLHVNYLDQPNG